MDIKEKIKNLPAVPAVYLLKNSEEQVIYIGKAINLKKRIASHFQRRHTARIDFYDQVTDVDFIKCPGEKEALILEADLIKRFKPKYNIEWVDGKNYSFIGFTKEKFPRVVLTHQPQEETMDFKGPFIYGWELKGFLKDIRKILPFRTCNTLPKKPCLYQDLKLCPAPCANKRKTKQYQQTVDTLKVLLDFYDQKDMRLECYDISNLSGTLAVGSMVVFENSMRKPSDYRLFKIKTVEGQNDVESLKEVLRRRFKHQEWKIPDLVLVDGGKPQLNAVKNLGVPALALAKEKKLKDSRQGKIFSLFSKTSLPMKDLPENLRHLFLQARDEAHRFAITFQKKRRLKALNL